MASLPTDEDIMKRKLLVDGDGAGDERRLNLIIRGFMKWYFTDAKDPASDLAYERVVTMLGDSRTAMAKSRAVYVMSKKETENYERLCLEIDKSIKETKEKITTCKKQLLEAKAVRKNRQQYDSMSAVIDVYPTRAGSLEKLKKVEDDVKRINEVKEELYLKLEKRKKQFHVLLNSAFEIQKLLADDEANESSSSQEPDFSEGLLEVLDIDAPQALDPMEVTE